MIQRAVTAIIGVVIGLFATFAVFGSVLGGLDNFYLLTQDTCNFGTANAPKRLLRIAHVADGNMTPEDVDWSGAYNLIQVGSSCVLDEEITFSYDNQLTTEQVFNEYWMTPAGDYIVFSVPIPASTVFPSVLIQPSFDRASLAIDFNASATIAPRDLTWIEAEGVFTAQKQLVTLLAVIAALGMPIGAMTAVVFFGQVVVSSGVSGQGASQVLVAIAAVVVILVAVQMFEQFAGYLGDAFDAVDGDRFVVFNETLGSLAETIAEFWGVLAFAGLINIATIVWRNYSGNFSIGGTGGGL